ncbi:TetR/AcrR family transcriptional regulator [Virgibacillus salinus]|uniref:Transcriptional regulator, TetR family n=1 Tax=Virgibacillus salinus TaxID=553311 RepID=A0A1H1EQM2_9BACI|nr:TetR/AcrR family transcriptional regulator [Virgibacillus salinus]SDQ90799.1 transcriptional regulator, TetR family [Virgibacillus salinus]
MKNGITEQSILLFEKKGFSHTSIQDIVNQLGVTKGTFYYYFSSKEQLLMEIHHEYITNLLEGQSRVINNGSLTSKQKLAKIIGLLINDVATNGPSARVYFREVRHLAEENIKYVKEKREQFRLNVEKIVREGMNKGEFKHDLKVDMITFGILGVTNWTYSWYKPNGEVSSDELVKIYVDMILNGIQ